MKQPTITQSSEKKEGELKAIVFLLQSKIEDMANEIHRSSELLKVGERTPLIASIEKSLKQPSKSIFNASVDLDNMIYSIIDKAVFDFFTERKQLVLSLRRITNTQNPLTYAIILNDDNFVNRMSIFDFFEQYDLTDFSTKYPVVFHFIPPNMEEEIIQSEVIQLN